MFLRFQHNGTLAEASPVEYGQHEYVWYHAPADYSAQKMYILDGTQVRVANSEEEKQVLLEQKKRALLQQLAIMVDDKRMQSAPLFPGKEREYLYKSNIVANASKAEPAEDAFGYALLSYEAKARGVSLDALVSVIKEKSLEAHQWLGKVAGFHVVAKDKIAQAATLQDLETCYQALLAELAVLA